MKDLVEGFRGHSPMVRLMFIWAFALPITIVVAEPLAVLLVVWGVWRWVRRTPSMRWVWHPLLLPMLLYFILAWVSWFFSVRPWLTGRKLPRLFLMALVPVIAGVAENRREPDVEWYFVKFFIAGCLVRLGVHLVRLVLWMPTGSSIFDIGNMRDPQMYLVGSCLCWGFLVSPLSKPLWGRASAGVWAALLAGILLNFKRGTWLALLVAGAGIAVLARKWRWLLSLALFLVALWVCPWSRRRIEMMRQEFSLRFGGRYSLWTQVAPALIQKYPWGMGYYATQNEDFRPYSRRLQKGLHHVHNNVLQVTIELGWLGAAVWLWWVTAALFYGIRNVWRTRSDGSSIGMSLGILGSIVGLLVNGMVEYNFGDSEILMLWYLVLGLLVRMDIQSCLSKWTANS